MSNPFTAPASDAPVAAPSDELAEVRALVVGMRFPQILIGGLVVLFGVVVMGVSGLAVVGAMGMEPGQAEQAGMVVGAAMVYGTLGALYTLPGGLLVRSGIAGVLATGDPEQVVTSLRAQLWFWRVLALYVLGITALYVLAFVALITAGVFGATVL